MSIITYNPRHANNYETGRHIYQQGVHSYQAVYISIRRLGYYLMCGDESAGMSTVQDDEARAKMIYDILTKTLYWSAERAKELWNGILAACKWRPPKFMEMTKKISEVDKGRRNVKRYEKVMIEEERQNSEGKQEENKLHSIDSTNSTRENSKRTTNTIYNYSKPEKTSKEEDRPSKEEVRAILKSVLGDKIDFQKPSGMMGTILKAISFRT
jgi:hypothetical protein